MKIIEFLNLPVISLTPPELPGELHQWMEKGTWVVTLNAEMMVKAYREPGYAQLLKQADVLLPDGYGLVLWSRGLILNRFPGVELSEYVLSQAEASGNTVVCLVAKGGLSSAAQVQTEIKRRWPKLQFSCVDIDPLDQPRQVQTADIVLVNFGVPKQDEWLHWMKQHQPFRLGIGVGGTFDYWTSHAKRPPLFFRRLGLESIGRLFRQPWRFKRVWNAVAVFSWLALWHKPKPQPRVASPA